MAIVFCALPLFVCCGEGDMSDDDDMFKLLLVE
jgi:hypothetical protein